MTHLFDRAIRARINQLAHAIGQQAAHEARQRIANRLEALRTAGADRTALTGFLALCEQSGEVVDATELKQ